MSMSAALGWEPSHENEESPRTPTAGWGLLEVEHTGQRRRWLHAIAGSRLLIGR